MKVCIAEKPSVAKEIADVLGAKTRRDGYYEGNGYAVTWTYGHLCRLQEPGDLLFFTSFLQGTLSEIYELTGKGLSFPPESDWLTWSASSYRPLHVSSETICLYFNSPVDVLRHLKHTGVTATGGEFWTRNRLASFVEKYQEKFQTTDGKVVLTFVPVYFLLERINRI